MIGLYGIFSFKTKRIYILNFLNNFKMQLKLNDANFQELVLNKGGEMVIVICVGTKEALSNPDAQQRMKAYEQNKFLPPFMRHDEHLIGIVDSTDPESVETAARFKANLGFGLGRECHPVETFIYDAGKHRVTMSSYINTEEIYKKVIILLHERNNMSS
jgi:hypothetical protein